MVRPDAASDADLLRIHTPAYIDAVKLAGDGPDAALPPSWRRGTDSVPTTPDLPAHARGQRRPRRWFARRRQEIASGRARRAVSIGGGMHHAMADWHPGSACTNDAAIAISWLLDNGFDRIAYVDIDAHHGDGVQHAFLGDPRV